MTVKRPKRRDQNGNAWRKLRATVLTTEDDCALCGRPVDKTLRHPHPMSPHVDHVIPVAHGGPALSRRNVRLAHAACNQAKGDRDTWRPPEPSSRAWL